MSVHLEILTSTCIKAKKHRNSFWWPAENSQTENVCLLEGRFIECLGLRDGKVKRLGPQLSKDVSTLKAFGRSKNGMYLCGLLGDGHLFLRNVTNKEVFVLDSPFTDAGLNSHINNYTRVFISDDSLTVLVCTGQFLFMLKGRKYGEQGYSWAMVDIKSVFDGENGLSKGSAVDAVFVSDDKVYGPHWMILIASTSSDNSSLHVSRMMFPLHWTHEDELRMMDSHTLPYSLTIGCSNPPNATGGSHWRNLVFPLESLFNEQCTSLKKKGCYVMSFSGDGRIVALAVNGRTASCCKMLFIDSSSDTTSVHPVYQSTEQGIGRIWWIADMKWTSDGLFIVAITKRGSLVIFPRMSSPIMFSTSGCSLDMGPETHMAIHPLIVVESTNLDMSTTHETSSSSEQDKQRQLFSVATHPILPLILCSDGYLVTILQVPTYVTSMYIAMQSVQLAMSALGKEKFAISAHCSNTGMDSTHKVVPTSPLDSALSGIFIDSEVANVSVQSFSGQALEGNEHPKSPKHGETNEAHGQQPESIILMSTQILSSSLALLLSSSHQTVMLDNPISTTHSLVLSWVGVCKTINRELLLGNIPGLVNFWKMITVIFSLDASDHSHLILSLTLLSPVLENLVNLLKSQSSTAFDCNAEHHHLCDVHHYLTLVLTTSQVVQGVIEALLSTYGISPSLCNTSTTKSLSIPHMRISHTAKVLVDHIDCSLLQTKSILEQLKYSNSAPNDVRKLILELQDLKNGLLNSPIICQDYGDDGSKSSLDLLSTMHSRLLSSDLTGALNVASSVIHSFTFEPVSCDVPVHMCEPSEPNPVSGLRSLRVFCCDPESEPVLCSLGSYMARYFMHKALLVPLPGNPNTVPLPSLQGNIHYHGVSMVEMARDESKRNCSDEYNGLSWSPLCAVQLLLFAGHWEEAAKVCLTLDNSQLALSLIALRLRLSSLLHGDNSHTPLALDSTDCAHSIIKQVVLGLSRDSAQEILHSFHHSQQQEVSVHRSGLNTRDLDDGERSPLSSALHCLALCGLNGEVLHLAYFLTDSIITAVKRLTLFVPKACSLPIPLFCVCPRNLAADDKDVLAEYESRQDVCYFFLQFLSILRHFGSVAELVTLYLKKLASVHKIAIEKNLYTRVLGNSDCLDVSSTLRNDEVDLNGKESCEVRQNLYALLRKCFLYLWYVHTRDQASLHFCRSVESYWIGENDEKAVQGVIWRVRQLVVARSLLCSNVEGIEDAVLSLLSELPPTELKAQLLAAGFGPGEYETRTDSIGTKFCRIMSELRGSLSDIQLNQSTLLSVVYVESFTQMQDLLQLMKGTDLDPFGISSLSPVLTELDCEYVTFSHELLQKIQQMDSLAKESTSSMQAFNPGSKQMGNASGTWLKLSSLVRHLLSQCPTSMNLGALTISEGTHPSTALEIPMLPEIILSALKMAENKAVQSSSVEQVHEVPECPQASLLGTAYQNIPNPPSFDEVDYGPASTSLVYEVCADGGKVEESHIQEDTVTLLSVGELVNLMPCLEDTCSTSIQATHSMLTLPSSTSRTLEAEIQSEEVTLHDEIITSNDFDSCNEEGNTHVSHQPPFQPGLSTVVRDVNVDQTDSDENGEHSDGCEHGDNGEHDNTGGHGDSDGNGDGDESEAEHDEIQTASDSEDGHENDKSNTSPEGGKGSEQVNGEPSTGSCILPCNPTTKLSIEDPNPLMCRAQLENEGSSYFARTVMERTVSPGVTTTAVATPMSSGTYQYHILQDIPISTVIPNDGGKVKDLPQSTSLDADGRGTGPTTVSVHKVVHMAEGAFGKASPILSVPLNNTTSDESTTPEPPTLNVDELESSTTNESDPAQFPEHSNLNTVSSLDRRISNEVNIHSRSRKQSKHDMKRIARNELKKMLYKVSDILNATDDQWLESCDTSICEPMPPGRQEHLSKVSTCTSSKPSTVTSKPDPINTRELQIGSMFLEESTKPTRNEAELDSKQRHTHPLLTTTAMPTSQLQAKVGSYLQLSSAEPSIFPSSHLKPTTSLSVSQANAPHCPLTSVSVSGLTALQPRLLDLSQLEDCDTLDSNSLGEVFGFDSQSSYTSNAVSLNGPQDPVPSQVPIVSKSGLPIHHVKTTMAIALVPPHVPQQGPPQVPPHVSQQGPPQVPPHVPQQGPPQVPPHVSQQDPPQVPPHVPQRGPPQVPPHVPQQGPPQVPPHVAQQGPPQVHPHVPQQGPPRMPPHVPQQGHPQVPPHVPQRGPPQVPPHVPQRGPPQVPPHVPQQGHPQVPPQVPQQFPSHVPSQNLPPLALVDPTVQKDKLYPFKTSMSSLPQLELTPSHPCILEPPQSQDCVGRISVDKSRLPMLSLPDEPTSECTSVQSSSFAIGRPPLLTWQPQFQSSFGLIYPPASSSQPPCLPMLHLDKKATDPSFHLTEVAQSMPLVHSVSHLPQLKHPLQLSIPNQFEKQTKEEPFQLLKLTDALQLQEGPGTAWDVPPHNMHSKQDSFQLLHPPLKPVSQQPVIYSDVNNANNVDALEAHVRTEQPHPAGLGVPIPEPDTASEDAVTTSFPSISPAGSSSSYSTSSRTHSYMRDKQVITTKDFGAQVGLNEVVSAISNEEDNHTCSTENNGLGEKVESCHVSSNILEENESVHSQVHVPTDDPAARGQREDQQYSHCHADDVQLRAAENSFSKEPNSPLLKELSEVAPVIGDRQTPTPSDPTPEDTPELTLSMCTENVGSLPVNEFVLVRDIEEDELSSTSDSSVTTDGCSDVDRFVQPPGVRGVKPPEMPVTTPTGQLSASHQNSSITHTEQAMMKSISQQKPSEGLSVDEALQTDPDSDDALSRLKRVEAQLKSLESTARKVQQEIHLDSYKLLGMLADRADVSTSASVDIVSDYDEAMHIRTLVHNSTDHTRVKNTARGHFSSELAHDPVPPASMSASTNRRSQQNTRSLPGAPLRERNRKDLRNWMERKRKESLKRFRKERQDLLLKERRPFAPNQSRAILNQEQRTARRKELEEEFHEQRVQDAFALMADIIQSQPSSKIKHEASDTPPGKTVQGSATYTKYGEHSHPHQMSVGRPKRPKKPLRRIASVDGLTEEEADAVTELLADVQEGSVVSHSSNSTSVLTDIDWTAVDKLLEQ